MRFLAWLLLMNLVLSGCPNQCSGHGTCGADGVCDCNKGSVSGSGGGDNYIYYGADCSLKACPLGSTFNSFSKVALPDGSSNSKNGGRLLKSLNNGKCGVDDKCESVFSSSNSTTTRILAVTSKETSLKGYYTINGIEYPLLKDGKGELVCKNELGEFVGKIKVIGKNDNGYVMKIGDGMKEEGEDASLIFTKYDCYVSFSYNDLSLINPVISEENKITWAGMKEILDNVKISVETAEVNFACGDYTNGLKVYKTKASPSPRRSLQATDIVFEFDLTGDNSLTAGLMCYYLGKKTSVDNTLDISQINSLQLNNGKDIVIIDKKKLYEIYNFEPTPTAGYASLNCFNKYTNELIGKAYLLEIDSSKKISKVVYDFELDGIDTYDLKCEIIEEYSEVTSLFPMKVEDDTGKITNLGVKDVITITNDNAVILGCYNPKSYEFTTYEYTYAVDTGVFTIKPPTSRRNLAEPSNPIKDDICYIIMNKGAVITSIDEATNAVSFVAKHLILTGETGKYKYFDENSIVYLPGTKVGNTNNIYILENVTFNVGGSGALVECTNENNNVVQIQVLQKIAITDDMKLNKYYVKYNKNKIGSGEYKCELIHQTTDLSLYELTKSNNCKPQNAKDEVTTPAECDLKLTSISYFLNPKFDSSNNYNVKIACSRGDSIEVYSYTYTAPAPPAPPAPANEVKDPADGSSDITFTIDKTATYVPSNNDICHIISYTENTPPRRGRRLDDADLESLTKSDYGKSLSNYIYKPSKSIEVDIGKINHKVYEVNNINIIPDGIDVYVGVISCKYGSNEGNGYVMGKSGNGYMILFDFINENSIPSINSYDCKLKSNYKDLSLYYSSVIKGQGSSGVGECYSGKCNIIWKGMGELLNKVTLEKGKTGTALLTNLRKKEESDPTLKFACMNKAKKVTYYEYNGNKLDSNDPSYLTFSLPANSDSFPLVGHVCNLLSDFSGSVNDINSEYILNPPAEAKLPPTLMSKTALVDNIFKVRRFIPTPTSIGYSVCSKGKDTIIAYNYGKIKSETLIDSYYIRYTDLATSTDISSPTPDLYSCKPFIPYKDTSSLIKVTGPTTCSSTDENTKKCQITLPKEYKDILNDLGIKLDEADKAVSFVCYSQTDNTLKIFSYVFKGDSSGLIFDRDDEITDYPKTSSKCSLLVDLEGNKIDSLKDSEIISLLPNTVFTTFNGKSIWKVTNINYGLGINKCYNKYTNIYVGDAIYYGKMKGEEYINLVSYTDKDGKEYVGKGVTSKDGQLAEYPTPEDYNCKSYKLYNDLSLLLTSDSPSTSTCTAKDSCYYQFTGIKPLLSSYGIDFSKDVEFNVGCEVGSEVKQMIFTTNIAESGNTATPNPDDIKNDDIVLYIKKDETVEYGKLKKCYILLNSDGSKLSLDNSDLSKLPYISSTEIIKNRKMYYAYNLGFNYKAGTMKCYNPKGDLGEITVYEKDEETYKVKLGDGLTVDGFYKYNCQEQTAFNDLSLFNPVTVSDADKITWSNIKTILDKLKFNVDNIKTGKFVCITGKTVSYVGIKTVAYGTTEGSTENLDFTVATSITSGNTCYLLSKFDGTPITEKEEIVKSDVGKKFGLSGDAETLPDPPTAEGTAVQTPFGNVYKVKNVKYTLNDNEIKILDCVDKKTSKHLGEAYVLSQSTTADGYYIYYSWIESNPPKPADYQCSESGNYSDLSLLFEITIKSDDTVCHKITEEGKNDASCDIELTGLKTIFPSFTSSSDKVYQFICSNSKKELHLYNYTIDVDAQDSNKEIFKIAENSDVVPYYTDKCNLLAKPDGNTVTLSQSEYGKKNGILIDNPNGQKVETSEKKVETVEPESIPAEIPKSGGILKCYDKESGEYVGTIEVIGKKANGEAIIKYNIQSGKMDINDEDLSIDLFDTEVESISKDMSLKNPPVVPVTCRSDSLQYCTLKWSGIGEILRSSMILRLRELISKEVELMCPNGKDGDNKNVLTEIEFTYDDSDSSEDIILTPKENIPENFEFKVGSECYVLVDGNGENIKKENSELFEKRVTTQNGKNILISDVTIEEGKGSSVLDDGNIAINIKYNNNINCWTKNHMLVIEIGDDKNERDL